jgi:hypothetical protein
VAQRDRVDQILLAKVVPTTRWTIMASTHAEREIVEAVDALGPVWDELYPAEQARILRLLIERIEVAPDGISVTLHAAGIRSLVAELADQETSALADPLLEAAE